MNEAPPPGPEEGAVGAVEAVEAAVEGVPGALSLAPSAVVPALGGELVLPGGPPPAGGDVAPDSVRTGLLQAGPLAAAGLLANGANLLVTIALAHRLTSRNYGSLNQLTGLFLIVSMPGSAVVVAVVRRVTAWRGSGSAHLVHRWASRVHRQGLLVLAGFTVLVLALSGWLSGLLGQTHPGGLVAMLVAGAVWIVLNLDRGLLQAHRDYRVLAGNLLVEGGVRTVAMLALVALGFGVTGAARGVLVAEVVTAVHARVMADRRWSAEVAEEEARGVTQPPADARAGARAVWSAHQARWAAAFRPDPLLAGDPTERRGMRLDLGNAFVALAMVALLQNIDVIVVNRENPAVAGSYAAVSVACKALVFGAIVLGGYLLPEAAIRWREGGHALRQLAVTLVLLGVLALPLLISAFGFPHLLITVVFGPTYLGALAAFGPLVVAMICLSTTVLLTMYLLAVGRRWITPLLVVAAVAATLAVLAAGGHPRTTARADLAVQAALALVVALGFARVHHRRLARR
jgi:O-antigen/teichoic acid export membrane protein